jgi:hypothetical protein
MRASNSSVAGRNIASLGDFGRPKEPRRTCLIAAGFRHQPRTGAVTLPPSPFRAYGSAVEADVPLPRAKSLAPTGHTLLRHRLLPERGGLRRLWTDLTVDPRVVQVEVLNRRGVPAYRVNVVPLAWEGANPFDGAEGLRVFILPWRGWLGGERRRGGRQDQATSDEQGEDSPRHDPTLFPTGRARQSGTTAGPDVVSGLLRQTGGFERRCHLRS